MPEPIRVLIVDDSAYSRKMLSQMLSSNPCLMVVGTAYDGADALAKVKTLKPDVVALDLNMPNLDGIEFVREQMRRKPLPIVVVSAEGEASERTLRALRAGAVDIVAKPAGPAVEKILEIQEELVAKVLAAAVSRNPPSIRPEELVGRPLPLAVSSSNFEVLLLGLSTGGPQALLYVLSRLPANFPLPIAVVLHMSAGFTAGFATHLNAHCPLEVLEASKGLELRPGRVILAKAGEHLHLQRSNGRVVCELRDQPQSLHRPSVDVLFESGARIFGKNTLAVVFTGMGNDGLAGSGWVKGAGGSVLAEHESSCVVYGMPRCVVEAKLADGVHPLPEMPERILSAITSHQ